MDSNLCPPDPLPNSLIIPSSHGTLTGTAHHSYRDSNISYSLRWPHHYSQRESRSPRHYHFPQVIWFLLSPLKLARGDTETDPSPPSPHSLNHITALRLSWGLISSLWHSWWAVDLMYLCCVSLKFLWEHHCVLETLCPPRAKEMCCGDGQEQRSICEVSSAAITTA